MDVNLNIIYADKSGYEVGYIDYLEKYDIAFGVDENTFSLTVPIGIYNIYDDYLIFIEGTEYGGIVDTIAPNTEEDIIVYSGRTWHGVLSKKVICPENGADYFSVDSQPAEKSIQQVIENVGLSDFFTVIAKDDIDFKAFKFDRYIDAYTGLVALAQDNKCKIIIRRKDRINYIYAERSINYYDDEQWRLQFPQCRFSKTYNPVNHLICLGSGELSQRKVIHLFTDYIGKIQPYTFVENPIDDSQYITDQRNKVITGSEELTEVFDFGNAMEIVTFKALQEKPEDWEQNYIKYYEKDQYSDSESSGGETNSEDFYRKLERIYKGVYVLQENRPDDWATKYGSYYTNDHEPVKGESQIARYETLTKRPDDWFDKYDDYYYVRFDGTKNIYESVSSDTDNQYTLTLFKPSDWNVEGAMDKYYCRVYAQSGALSIQIPVYDFYMKSPDGKKHVWVTSLPADKLKAINPDDMEDESFYDFETVDSKYKKYAGWTFDYIKRTSWKTIKTINTSTDSENYEKYVKPASVVFLVNGKEVAWSAKKTVFKASTELKWNGTWQTAESLQEENADGSKKPIKWTDGKWYYQTGVKVAPRFEVPTGYTAIVKAVYENMAPTWQTNTYYTYIGDEEDIPTFEERKFFERFEDNYADLIEYGIRRLKELRNVDSLKISFDSLGNMDYDISDIVGADELNTGITVVNAITKKILSITKENYDIQYEVGGIE